MKYIVSVVLLLIVNSSFSQDIKSAREFLLEDTSAAKVLMVGTFHFEYPNLDAHKTSEDEQIDIKSAQKQKELEEVLDYIARFKPNKIVVERWPESNCNDRYRAYLNGEFELPLSETYQIGFRLGKRFGLDSLYPCDAGTLVRSLYSCKGSRPMKRMLDNIYKDWGFESIDYFGHRYEALYSYGDSLSQHLSLLDYFKRLNDPEMVKAMHGAYLVSQFKNGTTEGADALAMHWYARNLRIFRNIQRINTSADDRILVIFGAGHSSILRQQFESTPEFELVEFSDLEHY